MFKYIYSPPPNPGFPSYVLISISKRHFQISPIFYKLKKLLIKNSMVAARQPLGFFYFQILM